MALPGINLSLDQRSDLPFEGMYGNWYERAIPLTVRERVMLDVMATLKNKSNWEEKVLDEAIVSRWRSEVCAAGDSWRAKDRAQTGELQSLAPRDAQRQKRVSKAMFQYVSDANLAQRQYANGHIVYRRTTLPGTNCKGKRLHGSARRECGYLHLRHGCES